MDKQELKEKLNDVVAKIKVNSKDQHYADTLVKQLLSLKGQIDVEPTLIHLPSDDIVQKMESDTFRIAILKSGEVVYHLKGGMDIVVQPKAHSLYEFLTGIVSIQDELEKLSDEERNLILQDVTASTYVLNIPFIAFGDLDFKYKLANDVIDYLVSLQDKYVDNAELQDETPDKNNLFEEAVMALEELKEDKVDGE
jgi:hypothetical protein